MKKINRATATRQHICPNCGAECTVNIHARKSTLCPVCSAEADKAKVSRFRAKRKGSRTPSSGLTAKTLARIEAIGQFNAALEGGDYLMAWAIANENGLKTLGEKARRMLKLPLDKRAESL